MTIDKQIGKLFAEIEKTNKLVEKLGKRVFSLEKSIDGMNARGFLCPFCHVKYFAVEALDAHLKQRGLH